MKRRTQRAPQRLALCAALVVGILGGGLGSMLGALPAGAAAADGSGTLTVAPTAVTPGSTGDTLVLTYTAASGGVSGGEIDVAVPAGWSVPSVTSTDPGYTTSTCGTVAVTGSTIQVTGVTVAGSATCTITYGSKASSGPGATGPGSSTVSTFAAKEKSTSGGTLTALASSPNVSVGTSPDGSGTITVSPSTVSAGSTGNTLTFTYTAAAAGLSAGEIDVEVPSGWSAPSTTATDPGYTTSTCGTVAVTTMTIRVTGVTLAGGATCTITYGSKASSGPGATAPSAQAATFSALEKSTAGGNLTPLASSPQVTVSSSITQIFGPDAIGTSIAISQAAFAPGAAKAVVLARSDFFSDALAGGPLAAAVGGPMLITPGASISATIDPRVLTEIQRVLPVGGTVYVLGGNLAISPTVDGQLEAAGYNVIREAGADEFDTAVKIAQQLGNRTTVFLATGLSFFDALSAVPAAINQNAAILLTNGSTMNLETALYLLQNPGDKVYAIGGPLAAYGADPQAIPVYGQDLYGTSAAVASTFFAGAKLYGAATSGDFPDALGGGVFMATGGRLGPVLLVPSVTPLPGPISTYLASLSQGTPGYVFGGPLVMPALVLAALQAAVG